MSFAVRVPVRGRSPRPADAGLAHYGFAHGRIPLPIVSHPLQAYVGEPLKPFLNKVRHAGWGTYGFEAGPAAGKDLAPIVTAWSARRRPRRYRPEL